MASNSDTRTSITDDVSITTCPGCLSLYKNPRLLQCCHSVCLDCIEVTNTGLSKCPKCQSVSDREPTALPRDVTIDRLTAVPRAAQEMKECGRVLCSECEEETDATHLCVTCPLPICELDFKVHKKMHRETHKIVGLGELSSLDQAYHWDNAYQCTFHPKEPAEHFCTTCVYLLCGPCFSHHRPDHDVSGLEETKNRVKTLSGQYRDVYERMGIEDYSSVQQFLQKVLTMRGNLEEQFDELKRILDQRKKEVIDKLDTVYKDTLTLIQKGEWWRSHLNDLMEKTRAYEDLPMDGQLLADLECINSKVNQLLSEPRAKSKYSNIEYLMDSDIKCRMKGLGCFRLTHTKKVLPKTIIDTNKDTCKYKFTPFTITSDEKENIYNFTQQCDVVVMDREGVMVRKFKPLNMPNFMSCGFVHWNKGLLYLVAGSKHSVTVCNENGKLVKTFGREGNRKGEIKDPLSIAVSNINGDIYVLEQGNNRVQVFNSEYIPNRFIGYYLDTPGQIKNPCELALTQVDDVVVVQRNIPSINVYSSQGELLHQFGSTSIGGQVFMPGAMSISRTGQLLLTDLFQDQIVVYGRDRLTMWTVGSSGSGRGEYSCPAGMVCMEDGTVYVCDISNERIQVYSEDSLLLGYNH